MSEPPAEGAEAEVTVEVDDHSEVDDVTANLTVYPDDPPSSGEWVDIDEVMANPTEEELAEGRILGEMIDPDNDESGSEPEDDAPSEVTC